MCEVTLEKLKIEMCETDKGEHFTYDNVIVVSTMSSVVCEEISYFSSLIFTTIFYFKTMCVYKLRD